jgi:putative FmdB family regulatory protein
MPSYDYVCQDCGHGFEEFQSMSADPLTTCPSCGQEALKRLIAGGLGVIFKGSGFYVTDSKKSVSSTSKTSGSGSVDTSSNSSAGSNGSSESTSGAKDPSSKPDTKKSDPVGSAT